MPSQEALITLSRIAGDTIFVPYTLFRWLDVILLTVDLEQLVEEAIDGLWIGYCAHTSALRGSEKCNKGRIRRVLMNLFGNSLKFSSVGYLVSLDSSLTEVLQHVYVHVSCVSVTSRERYSEDRALYHTGKVSLLWRFLLHFLYSTPKASVRTFWKWVRLPSEIALSLIKGAINWFFSRRADRASS